VVGEERRDGLLAAPHGLLKGDPDWRAVLRDGLVTRAREIISGKDA